MMLKHYLALERVFGAEIRNRLYQSTAKSLHELAEMGMVVHETQTLGRDTLGAIRVEGWALTHRGRIAYCEWCSTTGANRQRRARTGMPSGCFVLIPNYLDDDDPIFGVRLDDGDYELGDGDIYGAADILIQWPAAQFLSYPEIARLLANASVSQCGKAK